MKPVMKTNPRVLAAAAMLASALAACTSPSVGTTTAQAMPGSSSIQASCINPVEIEKQEIVSDKEIRFTLRGGDVWVNRLAQACNGLKFEGGFEWTVRGTLACSNQQSIKVLRQGTPCLLGEFTNLGKQPKAATPPA